MNQISNVTKRDLFEIIFFGYQTQDVVFGNTFHYQINYFGRLEIPTFLNRLYNLKELPSLDSRYKDAQTDIYVHTVTNDDYPNDFILDDERFNLREADDITLLNFICEMFHPEVRDENSGWVEIKYQISRLLSADGYTIIPIKEISGREIYGWRYAFDNIKPFSIRNELKIKNKDIKFSLGIKTRKQILEAFSKYDENITESTETGYNYNYWLSEKLLENIEQFYEPMNYDSNNNYIKSKSLQDFIMHSRPYCVLDAIEIFISDLYNYKFVSYINSILDSSNSSCHYRIKNGFFTLDNMFIFQKIQLKLIEKGVQELMEEAISKYHLGNIQDAVEKLWDALERIKTVLIPGSKKQSAHLLLNKMSNNDVNFYNLYNDEILALTRIGNNYRIRHHEIDKFEIKNHVDWEYLYNRCSSFLNVAIKYIN